MADSLQVHPLSFLRKSEGKLLQAIRVRCAAPAGAAHDRWTLRVIRGSRHEEFLLHGEEFQIVFLAEPDTPVDTTFLALRGDARIDRLIRMGPVRRWTVHVVLHSHTDLGFTAPVSDVVQLHNVNTDRAIEFCRETAHLGEGIRFRWTCEVAWQVQNYIRDRTPEQVAALMQLVREGEIGVGALYSGELTGLLGHEEAVRSFAYAGFLRRRYGIPCDTALLCDVPGCTAGLVQIMAKSGVSSLIVADNNFMAPFLRRTDLPRPFFWKGSDNTEVLTWFTDHPYYAYVEGEYYGFLETREKVEQMLGDKLLALEQQGYPYSRFQIQYAFDNAPLTFAPAEIVRGWTAHWEYPKVVLSTAGEFLAAMRKEHGAGIPRRTGDWTDWWGGIVAAFPVDEALARQYQEETPATETLSTHLMIHTTGAPVSDPRLARVYDGLLAFDEHSGGGNLWQPRSREQQDRALHEGYGFLHSAIEELEEVQRTTLERLSAFAAQPDTETYVGIYNPSGVAVSRYVEIAGEGKATRAIHVRELPPYGYRLYPAQPFDMPDDDHRKTVRARSEADRIHLEAKSCSMAIDRTSGRWVSYLDKHFSGELLPPGEALNVPCVYVVRPACEIVLGKYIPQLYEGTSHPGDFLPWPAISVPAITWSDVSPGTVVCTVEHRIEGIPWLIQQYRLSEGHPGVTIVNTLLRACVVHPSLKAALGDFLHPGGMLYFHFPFSLQKGYVEYEATCSVLRPAEEQLRGSCHDFAAVRRWCALRGTGGGVLLTVPDTPLIDIGSVGLHKFKECHDEHPSAVYVRAVMLRDWGGPDESPYTCTRDLVFRFSVSFISDDAVHDAGSTFRAEAHRRAVKDTAPLFYFLPLTGAAGIISGIEHRFLCVTPDTVEVMVMKPAEAGNGWIIRLREVIGAATKARLAFPDFRILTCRTALMTEETGIAHPHTKDEVAVSFEPFAIVTLLLELIPRDSHVS
jgi:hypothetical protein